MIKFTKKMLPIFLSTIIAITTIVPVTASTSQPGDSYQDNVEESSSAYETQDSTNSLDSTDSYHTDNSDNTTKQEDSQSEDPIQDIEQQNNTPSSDKEETTTADEDTSNDSMQDDTDENNNSIGLSFDNSTYYATRAVGVSINTNNSTRKAIAEVAYSQLGSTDWEKYCPSSGYEPWCVYFANWSVHQVVNNDNVWPNTGSTNALIKWFQDRSRWHNRTSRTWSYSTKYGNSVSNGSDDGYTPQPGDFAAIENQNWSNEPDHTALVYSVDDNYIYTVEGNISSAVVFRKYGRSNLHLNNDGSSNSFIVGFGEPDFGGGNSYQQPQTNHKPTGVVDYCAGEEGVVSITGWAYDPDSASESIDIHVYIGGLAENPNSEPHNIGPTQIYRDDVCRAYGISGNHGYSAHINTNKTGQQEVCIYAIDSAGGTNTLIGRKQVNILTPSHIDFDKESTTIKKGESSTINCNFSGDGLYRAILLSNDENIATVEFTKLDWSNTVSSFKITGKKAGTTDVYLAFEDKNGKELLRKTVRVQVEETEDAAIILDRSDISLQEGKVSQIKIDWKGSNVAILDAYVEDTSIASSTWGNSNVNERYAYLNITGVKPGSTKLVTRIYDSNNYVICEKKIDIKVTEKDVSYWIKSDFSETSLEAAQKQNVPITFSTDKIQNILITNYSPQYATANWISKDIKNGKATLEIQGIDAGLATLKIELLDINGKFVANQIIKVNIEKKKEDYNIFLNSSEFTTAEKEDISIPINYSGEDVSEIGCISGDNNIVSCEIRNKDINNKKATLYVYGKKRGKTGLSICLYKTNGDLAFYKNVTITVNKGQFADTYYLSLPSNQFEVEEGKSIDVVINHSTKDIIPLVAKSYNTPGLSVDWVKNSAAEEQSILRLTGLRQGNSTATISLYDTNNNLLEMSTISVAVTAKSNNNDDSITKLPDSSANSVTNQPVTYKITYLLGGNNVNNSGNINSYSPKTIKRPIRLLSPIRYGYTFDGWYDINTGERVYMITKDTSGDLNLIAKWKENKNTNNNGRKPYKSAPWYAIWNKWGRWFK